MLVSPQSEQEMSPGLGGKGGGSSAEAEIRLPSGLSCRWRTRLLICLSSFYVKKLDWKT